jgi:hypothetical protein
VSLSSCKPITRGKGVKEYLMIIGSFRP